jgi:hypothetical protein
MTTGRSSIRRNLFATVSLAIMALMLPGVPAAGLNTAAGPLDATFEAHGGLKQWRKLRQMTYTLNGFPLSAQVARPNRSTVDLYNRFNRIEGEGFIVAFDGTRAWCTPGPEAVGLPPRFFALGSFYFIGMPFVFADPGVVLQERATETFRGKAYRVVQVSYPSGTGYSSKDDYTLFIDPETDRLGLIHHSVTETGVERVTWVFDEWQKVEKLLVPVRMTLYMGWNPDDPGDGKSFTIEDVRFSRKAPDPDIYAPPTDAVIDDSPPKH